MSQSMDKGETLFGATCREINGVRYRYGTLFGDPLEWLPAVRELKLRDDDIWMGGYPRSGHHWTFEILNMVLKQITDFSNHVLIDNLAELNINMQAKLDQIESPRVITSHVRPINFSKDVVEKKIKIVYILRNPKDVAVSIYKTSKLFSDKELHFDCTFNEFFDTFITEKTLRGSWFDHVLSMEKFMHDHPDVPVYVLVYERMKENPEAVIQELCSFLGKPTDLAEDIAICTEFQNMSKALSVGTDSMMNRKHLKDNTLAFLRKGEIGDWKNCLTVQQSESLDGVFEEKMTGSRLAELVKKYME